MIHLVKMRPSSCWPTRGIFWLGAARVCACITLMSSGPEGHQPTWGPCVSAAPSNDDGGRRCVLPLAPPSPAQSGPALVGVAPPAHWPSTRPRRRHCARAARPNASPSICLASSSGGVAARPTGARPPRGHFVWFGAAKRVGASFRAGSLSPRHCRWPAAGRHAGLANLNGHLPIVGRI